MNSFFGPSRTALAAAVALLASGTGVLAATPAPTSQPAPQVQSAMPQQAAAPEVAPQAAPPCAPCTETKPAPKKPVVKPKPHVPHWGYEGAIGPEHWGKLHSLFGLCDSGKNQSPIDLTDGLGVDVPLPRFEYRPSRFSVLNNGHTLQVSLTSPGQLTFGGKTYQFSQVHFHRPGEERLQGKSFEMGAHLVHRDSKGALAVVAVLMTVGREHPVVQAMWNHIPLGEGKSMSSAAEVTLDLNQMLPKDRQIFHYSGSLTTPPCSEGVEWIVFKDPIEVSPEQLRVFARLFPLNARPIQPVNGRLIKESRGAVR
jgi:carbonic anhydrase